MAVENWIVLVCATLVDKFTIMQFTFSQGSVAPLG